MVDAVGWPLGASFVSANTILPMFVARLAGSNLFVGLLSGVQSAGQFLPQLVTSHWVERLPVARRYVVTVGLLAERLPILVLAAAIFLGADPPVLLAVFFACWAVMNVGTGINSPAYFTMLSKCIPAAERAGLIGFGNAAGTLLASGGALVARRILVSGTGLAGYGWCFCIGALILIATVIPFAFVDEPAERRAGTRSLAGHLRGIPGLLRSNRGFSVYVAMQVSLQLALAGVAFVTGYAVLKLRAGEGTIAVGSAILLATEALGSVILGAASDRWGCRPAFIAAGACGAALYGVMALSPPIGAVLAAYVLAGLLQSAWVVGNNMTMEFAPPGRTATYSAVVFSAMAPVRIAGPLLLGVVADAVGTPPVFLLAAVSSAVALFLAAARLEDPRRAQRVTVS